MGLTLRHFSNFSVLNRKKSAASLLKSRISYVVLLSKPMSGASDKHPLWVYNSLQRKKTQFIPSDPNGLKVTWYCCGPTVYDAGHLGHARNYVSTDILRRIMEYMGYNVEFVMNITDVDDKIILRARQQHLLRDFKKNYPNHIDRQAVETATAAYTSYAHKNLPELPRPLELSQYESEKQQAYGKILDGGTLSGQGVPGDREAKVKMHIKIMDAASTALETAIRENAVMASSNFFAAVDDIMLPYLDSLHGSEVRSDDYSIFKQLTQYWELRFEEDLRLLNCLPPTRLTRVTEHMDDIIAYVKKIISKNFAYPTSDGSVYFDIAAFEAAGNKYARLEPWNRNDEDLQADGEGSLTKKNTEKKSDADFALWKSSKPGEPSWESPWGRGRPGWHIECSAMASAVLGSQMDIHSGGIDLAFPHHDNELAQSEAYWVQEPAEGCGRTQHEWVKYFLHMGHLSIKGSKMSKSLKNFTTIDEAMKGNGTWTARRLRIVFLLGGWREPIEITSDVVRAAAHWETTINNFFASVRALIADEAEIKKAGKVIPQVFREHDRELRAEYDAARLKFDGALYDSFNTPVAMRSITDLTSSTTIYFQKSKPSFSLNSVTEIARWITRMVEMLGLDPSGSTPTSAVKIGWSDSSSRESGAGQSESGESNTEFHRKVSQYRDGVRGVAKIAPTEVKTELLRLSDNLRDFAFTEEGVYLDDRDAGQAALIKYVPKEELIAARERRLADALSDQRKKEAAKVERDRIEQEKIQEGRLSHLEMFRTDKYSAWNENGIPTKDAHGDEITRSRGKKLMKEWERQKKKHETWLASEEANVESQ